mgnify:CR=1 FL=1
MKFGNITIGKQLFVGWGLPKALGLGEKQIRGAGYVEGPLQIGKDTDFDELDGSTLMVGHEYNTDKDEHSTTSLHVKGDVKIDGDGQIMGNYAMKVGGNVFIDYGDIGDLQKRFKTADDRPKPFDMVHPSRGEGQRLRYACIEGPEVGVYYRGRVRNKNNVITLPAYWRDLVHTDSISVQLQPIGAHQDVIVKRWDNEKIYLQAQGGMPVDCFFHVYAERKDVNKLVTEYEGDTWADYPDPEYNDPKYGGQNIVTG